MAIKKKAVKKKAAKKKTAKKAVKRKKAAKKAAKKTAKKTAKRQNDEESQDSSVRRSLTERRRALRKRRRTIRLKSAGTAITSVNIVAGTASRSTLLTRTRIIRKRDNIGVLPIDKNVMIKELIQAGSVSNLATRFGVTKQAIGSWFGRRGLQAIDVTDGDTPHKKEIM